MDEGVGDERPLVFISHDSRDANLAHALHRLIRRVSGGRVNTFRSSTADESGVPYGVEWYPRIKGALHRSTRVVCIITPRSIGRPWILFEAGFASSREATKVHGVAVGVSLAELEQSGPFKLLQNAEANTAHLTQLASAIAQEALVHPDEELVALAVAEFLRVAQDTTFDDKVAPPTDPIGGQLAEMGQQLRTIYEALVRLPQTGPPGQGGSDRATYVGRAEVEAASALSRAGRAVRWARRASSETDQIFTWHRVLMSLADAVQEVASHMGMKPPAIDRSLPAEVVADQVAEAARNAELLLAMFDAGSAEDRYLRSLLADVEHLLAWVRSNLCQPEASEGDGSHRTPRAEGASGGEA